MHVANLATLTKSLSLLLKLESSKKTSNFKNSKRFKNESNLTKVQIISTLIQKALESISNAAKMKTRRFFVFNEEKKRR